MTPEISGSPLCSVPPLAPLRSRSWNTTPDSEERTTVWVVVSSLLPGSGSSWSLVALAVLRPVPLAGSVVQRAGISTRTRPSRARSPMRQVTTRPTSRQLPRPVVCTPASAVAPRFCQVIAAAPPSTSSPSGRVSVTTTPSPLSGLVPLRSRERLCPGPWLITSSTNQNGWCRLTVPAAAGSGWLGSALGASTTLDFCMARSERVRMLVSWVAVLLLVSLSASAERAVTEFVSVSPVAGGAVMY